jgi:aminobenzoyl-glutamate utilization protein B
MKAKAMRGLAVATILTTLGMPASRAAQPSDPKQEAAAIVDGEAKQIQVMVDQVFSFAEPGFQEFRTSDYLQGILAKNGFKITPGVAGIPTAFTATWGEGGPLIALGADIDDLLGVSQYPGIPNIKPMVEGAPGHGEGHNAGMPVIIAAALAVKQVMEKNHLSGRLMIWPGVAEELVGSKAHYVHAGLFKDVDACLFVHVASQFGTGYGQIGGTASVSVQYTFHGKTAHAADTPWEGRSALDAVELMDVAWNFRREHLPLTQRSHDVITNGGDQPNIVPATASVWYYFRDTTFGALKNLYDIGNDIADGAAKQTGTTVEHHVLGNAAPVWGNKALAEAAWKNIDAIGMPKWDANDQAFAKAVQEANHRKIEPLRDQVAPLSTPQNRPPLQGGGSDDMGDITWTVPGIVILYPSNIPNLINHNAQSAMAMATPIAHKGAVVGAKAVAMTVIDLMTKPQILVEAKDYFQNVELKVDHYQPLIGDDPAATWMNAKTMKEFRLDMEKFYYNPKKYSTYLEQLGIKWPTLTEVK